MYTEEELRSARKRIDLVKIAEKQGYRIDKTLKNLRYKEELNLLQQELVKLQHWFAKKGLRVAILFEGRDAAGKGGSIKRFKEHLNPRSMRVVALAKPTKVERGQ